MKLILLLAVLLGLSVYMSVRAHVFYPKSVELFCGRMKDSPLIIRLLYRFFGVGSRIVTAYGVGQRIDAGLREPLWCDAVMFAGVCLYFVVAVKVLG
ncbi:MAG: hypothetical protein ABJO71_24435 [Pseudoruegeria sp.]